MRWSPSMATEFPPFDSQYNHRRRSTIIQNVMRWSEYIAREEPTQQHSRMKNRISPFEKSPSRVSTYINATDQIFLVVFLVFTLTSNFSALCLYLNAPQETPIKVTTKQPHHSPPKRWIQWESFYLDNWLTALSTGGKLIRSLSWEEHLG